MVVALAEPDDADKTKFYHAHLQPAGLRLVNADVLARELQIGPYEATKLAASIRRELIRLRESFVFEPVFSDPVGDKLSFLREEAAEGYTVLHCFVGISGPEISDEREAMRVFDNDNLRTPFRLVVVCEGGRVLKLERPVPAWLELLLPPGSGRS